jgi:hypothetical protein
MTLAAEIARREIQEVLHFTTNRGIVGILAKYELLSRKRLPHESYLQHVLHINSATRPEEASYFDKSQDWLDYINLSISEINRRFLDVSQRWHMNSDVWWGILAFDPQIMTHDGVYFATTNNAYEACLRKAGVAGLEALFGPQIKRKPGWYANRAEREPSLPTCEQAEVLYPGVLSTEYLRRIYVEQADHQDVARGWLREFNFNNVDVVLSTVKFSGRRN